MASSAIPFVHPPQLDCFLHAIIGIEHNGMETSVLSTLARLGHDPWVEAARLAGLPRAVAADNLAGALASAPAGTRPHAEARAAVIGLVRLLPAPNHLAFGATSAKQTQGSRKVAVLLVGSLLSAALTSGLLIDAAFWPAFHAGLPTTRATPEQVLNGSDADVPSSRLRARP